LYLTPSVRKLTAIVLISLLCFNWYGYRIAIYCFQTRSDASLQAKLDRNQYNDKDLIEVRIPINIPYYTDWSDFESYEGETTINGEHYRYVKRKLVNNELILLCVPNKTKTQLKKAGEEFFKHNADVQQVPGKKSGKEHQVKLTSSEYTCMDEDCQHGFDIHASSFAIVQGPGLSSRTVLPPAQPPDC